MSIREIIEKCKSKEALTTAIVVLTGFGSFGLGRLSVIEENRQPVTIEYPSLPAAVAKSEILPANGLKPPMAKTTAVPDKNDQQNIQPRSAGQIVASRTGTKYHFPWCAGARTISEKNKIWFNSEEEARQAGYLPASNCKGLK